MGGESREVAVEKIHEFLKAVAQQVRESIPEPIPISKYVITKVPFVFCKIRDFIDVWQITTTQ